MSSLIDGVLAIMGLLSGLVLVAGLLKTSEGKTAPVLVGTGRRPISNQRAA